MSLQLIFANEVPQNLIWLRHKVQVSAMLIVIALLLTLAGSPCPLSWRNFFLRRSFFDFQ